MRKLLIAGAALACIAGSSPTMAQYYAPYPYQWNAPPGWWHHHHKHWHGYRDQCADLRAACMHREELGEQGRGNCRRYREMCVR
jgi:hypothetical protein